jgi:hypothetical protein
MKKLKPQEDAFGQALSTAFMGEEVFEIVERDDEFVDAMKTSGISPNMKTGVQMSKEPCNL